jgi:maltooligosyltrehalose synthase
MASLSAITDITKPIDFSIFSNSNKAQLAMTKEQQAAMEKIATFTNDTSTAETVSADMELDNAIQELMPWMKVMRTKDGKEEESVITDSVMMDSMMKKSQRHDDHPRAKR